MTVAATQREETGACSNPMCSCIPCGCSDCRCGVASLGELEDRVMNTLWERPGDQVTVRQLAERFPEHAYTTVATVLDRLAGKGMVRRDSGQRVVRYAANGSRSAHTAMLMVDALRRSDDPLEALNSFARTLLPAEVAALGAALARPPARRSR